MQIAFVPRAAAAALALAVSAVMTTAAAQIIPGSQLSFTGTASAQDIGRPGVVLDFFPQVVAGTSGNTGTFASLNRSSGAGVSGSIADLLVSKGPQSIPGFLTLGGYRFDLLSLPSGPFGQSQCYVAPRPGQRCTPYQSELGNPLPTDPLSPFYMVNFASGDPNAPISSVVAFNLIGTVTGPGGATLDFFGTISSVFPGLPFQYVLGGLEEAGGAGQALPGLTFTGTFYAGGRSFASGAFSDEFAGVEVVPEPATVALVAVGIAGVAGVARRRRGA